MIDSELETLITVNQARKEFPKRPSINSIYRWIQNGISGGTKLDSIRVGGRVYTSKEACRRFFEEVATGYSSENAAARRNATRAAQNILNESGL